MAWKRAGAGQKGNGRRQWRRLLRSVSTRLSVWAVQDAQAGALLRNALAVNRSAILRLLAIGLVNALLAVVPSIIIRELVDDALPRGGTTAITIWGALLSLVLVAEAALGYARASIQSQAGESISHQLRDRLYTTYLRLPFNAFTTTHSGEFVSRVMNDATIAQIAAIATVPTAAVDLLSLAVMVG